MQKHEIKDRLINPSLVNIRGKIRHGTEPDNPSLLALWFMMEQDSHVSEEALYIHQYRLLLDTIVDELVPQHWRQVCLDHIYRPLMSLQRLSANETSAQHVRHLINELKTQCYYSRHGL